MQLGRASSTALSVSLLLVGMGAATGHAQSIQEGKLTGTVVSEDRLALPGATIEISSPALITGTRSTTTSSKGSYVFLNLPPGKYKLSASSTGFKTVTRDNIDVAAGAVVTQDLTLPVGTMQETIEVSGGSIVNTKTSSIETRFDSDLVEKLPTSRDAFYDLSLTAPGMSEGSGAPTGTTEFQSPTAYSGATN